MRPSVDRRRTKKAASTSGRGLGSIFKKLIGKVTRKAVGNTAKSALKRLATKKTLGSIVRIGKKALQRDPHLKQTILKESKQVVTDVAKSILQPGQKKKKKTVATAAAPSKKIDINSRKRRIEAAAAAAAASVPTDTVRPLKKKKKKKTQKKKITTTTTTTTGIPLKGWRKALVGDGIIFE